MENTPTKSPVPPHHPVQPLGPPQSTRPKPKPSPKELTPPRPDTHVAAAPPLAFDTASPTTAKAPDMHHNISEHIGLLPEDTNREGGEKALPQISITAFYERNETMVIIKEMNRDWRMKRTNLNLCPGGLPEAINLYQKETTPDLILIETGMRGTELFNQLDRLASVCDSKTKVIIIGASNDIRLYRQLMDQGISEYVIPPFHPLAFIRALSNLYTNPDDPFIGRMVAFLGAKGGAGSSSLVHNIAWILAESLYQKVSLIDLDAAWGTSAIDFAYDGAQGLEEILSDASRLDEALLDKVMLHHGAYLSILPAASALETIPSIPFSAYEQLLEKLRHISPLILLDMPRAWEDWSTHVLTSVDDIVITATPDLVGLRNSQNLLNYLRTKRPNDSDPIFILNKVGRTKEHEINVKDFTTALELPPSLVIGYQPAAFMTAINNGKMLTHIKSATHTVMGLNYLAERLQNGKFPDINQYVSGNRKSIINRKSIKNKSSFSLFRR